MRIRPTTSRPRGRRRNSGPALEYFLMIALLGLTVATTAGAVGRELSDVLHAVSASMTRTPPADGLPP